MNISNYESDKIINGTNDNDTISNSGTNVTINALGGNDSLYNTANYYSKINGGDGKDTISNAGFRTEIEGNAGDDYIFNTGWDISINGATGNDTVFLGSGSKNEFIVYNVGDDNDVINGFNSSSTLSIAAASYTSSKSGNDIIVNVGNGKITLAGAAKLSTVNIAVGVPKIYVDKDYSNSRNYVMIVGNDSNNNIENNLGANNVTIQTNGGNDSISNYANNVSISGGTGDDTIYGRGSGGYSFLGGDAGNDSIKNNGGYNVTTSGGEGNDTIRNWGYYDKINGGTGDDFIFLQSDSTNELILYNAGDGNDVINGFRADSTLSLAGTGYATTKSGDDVIVTVRDGQITLKGAGNLSKVNIIETPLNITNDKSNVTVLGTAYSDTITNKGEKVSLSAQSGNDIIANSADNVTINAGTGNDSISVGKAEGNLIQYQDGDGNDIITGLSEKSSISIGGAAYTSVKSVNDVFIKVGDGVLTVRGGADLSTVNIIGTLDPSKNFNNIKDNALIIANDLDNTIENIGKNVRVFANGGNDSISNGGANVTIDGGNGDDTIYGGGGGGYSSLSGGAGNDSINNYGGYNVTTSGGAGNDSISNWGYYDKINGGTGDDFIYLYSSSTNELILYNAGDGKDTIEGFKTDSTLDVVGANYATEKSGNDIIVYVGDDGEITLKGAAALSRINISGVEDKSKNLRNYKDNVSMVGSNYADTLENSGKNVTIIGNAGNDSIRSYGESVTVDGGRGNDSIDNSGSRSIIEGGAGNDTIRNGGGYNVTSSGGAGNDSIYNYGYDDKIDGGAGDDFIFLQSDSTNELILYNAGDGNDLIDGFKADSTLSINGGIYATTTQSGSDIIVTVGEGKITLLGAATLKTVNIVETPVSINNNDSNATIYGTNADDTIINTGENVAIFGLSGKDSLDNNNQGINSTIDGGAGDDKISNTGKKSTLTGQSGNDTIQNNADNVSISGGAGHDSIFNHGEEVSIAGGAGNDIIENDTNSHKVLIEGGAGNDSIRSESAHNVTITSGDGNNIIENQSGTAVSIVGGDEGDVINIKGALQNTILAGKGDDTISVDWSSNNALIIYRAGDGTTLNPGDGNDVIEDFNENSTLQIGETTRATYATQISGDDVIVMVADNKITIKNGAKLPKLNIDGLSRRLINNSDSKVELLGGDLNDSIRNTGFEVTMKGFRGLDTIQNYTRQNTIDAGAGDDFVESKNSNFVTIDGGAGNDAIVNRGGFRSTITGGAGNDSIDVLRADEVLINYKAGDGDDYIEGFNASSSLSIAGGVFSTTENGRDVIVTVNENEITLAGAASISPLNILGVEDIHLKVENKNDNVSIYGTMFEDSVGNIGTNVTILTQDGNDSIYNGHWNDKCSNVTIDAGKGDDTIINEGGSTVSIIAGEGDDYVENSDTDVTISGDAGNDSIRNTANALNTSINAGAGNDSIDNISSNTTITGGLGDDTISNNWDIQKGTSRDSLNDAGSNVLFNYNLGDGNDVIYGFKYNSTLSISGGSYSSQVSGSDIIVTVGDDNITLKNGADLKQVNIIGKNSKAAIEGSAVNIAGEEYNPLNTVNYADNVSIVGTMFDDTIENYGSFVTILANGDNDSILNKALNTSILGGAGDDTVANIGAKVTILAEAGDDSINNYGKFSELDGGAGSDIIENSQWGNNALISGGKGNDTVKNWAVNVQFNYKAGDGSDLIEGFNATSTLSIAGGTYKLDRIGEDLIVTVGDENITLKGAASLSAPNIIGEQDKSAHNIENKKDGVVIRGTDESDTIDNSGSNVTILALGSDDSIYNGGGGTSVIIDAGAGNDSIENRHVTETTIDAGDGNDYIFNNANNGIISGGAGNDTVYIDFALANSVDAGAGNDSIYVDASNDTIIGGEGNDTITLSYSDTMLMMYTPGDGNDLIQGFKEDSTLSIASNKFSTIINGDDVIVTVGKENITLEGAATVEPLNIVGSKAGGSYVIFTVKGSEVTYETDIAESIIKKTYQFKKDSALLTLNDLLKNYIVTVKNQEETSVKVNWHYGTASLSSASVMEYKLEDEKNYMTLTSTNYGDKLTFNEDATITYDDITADLFNGSAFSTKGKNAISFANNSSAKITAPAGAQIDIGTGTFIINNLNVNSTIGAGTITVADDGLSFNGYGVQFIDLDVAKENYFKKVTPVTVSYKTSDKSYAIYNTACVKTLAHDFTKITLAFDDASKNVALNNEKYAYYKVNSKEFLAANNADNLNVIEAKDSKFKIQGKEVEAGKISRVTIDEQISFTGTEIDFNDVKVNYAQNKVVSYTLDGKKVTIDKSAVVVAKGDTKTFNCAAGTYIVNDRIFETTAALTFTADANEIKIPLNDAKTEIHFDGVEVSGVKDGGELVFDLANDKIFVPSGAIINVTSSEAVKLNLVAGDFTVNDNKISSAVGIEITADKDNIKVPLSENPVTINGAKITGTHDATIDSQKIIALPDGALVQNTSDNTFKLTGKDSSISFGDANKKVLLTDDGTAYMKYAYENVISVGLNSIMFENVQILGNDAWTIETAGTNGVDKIKDITSGATITASTAEDAEVDLKFDVETEGNGTFTICEQKFISTGDAQNIFTVSNLLTDSDSSTVAVTAITKKLGTVDGNFEKGIQVNAEDNKDDYIVKASNSDKDIEIALNTEGKMSVEKIEGGANVEKYGKAQKVITVKNDKEYSLQVADYKYTVSGDLDDDGITFELVDGDFKVRTLYEKGKVTRYNVNDSEQLVWTWSIEQDKWIREQQSEDAPYEITINADKTLTLKANGVVVNPYSNQVITNPKSGKAVENGITITAKAIDGTTTFINNAEDTPNIFVADDQIITALAEKSSVQVDKRSFTLKSETATATTFKLDKTRNTLKIASDYKIIYLDNYDDKTEVKLENDNNDIALSNCANVVAPAGKTIQFNGNSYYTVNDIRFDTSSGSKAETVAKGVKFDLSTGKFQYKTMTLEGTGTAQITQADKELITLTDGAIVKGGLNKFKYYNRRFLFSGNVELIGKKFSSNKKVRGGLIYFQTSIADYNPDGSYTEETVITTGFVVGTDYVEIQENVYDSVKIVDEKISSVEGVKNLAVIAGNGSANISIVTTGSGSFTIGGKTYKVSGDNDGVTFVTDKSGNVAKVNGLNGSIIGNFVNEISVNGKAIRLTGASSIKVASDGSNISEISNVAGDLITTDGKTYRKDVYVYKTGGAKKLTTSADGIIIFKGNSFETNAGKTFELDEAGNVLGLEKVQANETANVLENVAENLGTITLSTTSGLEEVIGDFSEGLTVNGVFVRVTDSTNFVVKNDDENIYIETTAADTFTINGRTFTTSANKTIFKLDASGNVSEIVTDRFLPDEEAYLIEGDFSNEIIFNGQKFCVTGINDTSIFIGDETLITIELARNAVNVVESGGASEIALTGEGDITVGGKTFSTSSGFVGTLKINSAGDVYSLENFNGTISGELGGIDLAGLTIESDDSFSVTGNGEKVIAIENLQNGTLTSDNLDAITINGEKITLGDSGEVTLTVTDGKLTTSDEEILDLENAKVITENTTLKGGEVVVVEDTSAKLKITASKGADTIYTAGKNVDIDLKGGATKIYAAGGRATVENYKATSGAGFITKYSDLNSAIDSGAISFRKGKLKIDSAVVDLGTSSELINFYDAADDIQKIGFASDDAKFDASNETENLILIGGNGSTIAGGKGHNQIRLDENSDSTILLNGKNTVENFNASFDGDKISLGAATYDFSFDGANVSVKSGDARAWLQNISSDDDAARILTVINGKEIKTAIAQEGLIIAAGNDTADAYYGKKSGVDFTGFGDSLTVDLNENFYGINRVTLGGGQNTLLSSSQNETLTSSDGTTEFIFAKDSGRDLIKNFNFDADRINVGNETITAVNVNSVGGVRMEISGSATLTLENAQGKNFQINNFVALVDKNLTYNAEANYFVATAQNATLTVGESAEIWLDGSHGKYFSGDIKTLDASTAQGNTSLVGNDLDNTILAGNGDSSLWGGNLGNDFMQGGTGKNTFFYTVGNGNDTISGANNGDVINLAQVTLEQIASSNITADSVSLNFKDGGSLQINSAADITYKLADGSRFSANHEQLAWLTK